LNPCAAPVAPFAAGQFSALAAVHAACAHHCASSPSRLSSCLVLDREYLVALGLEGRKQAWDKACNDVTRRDGSNEDCKRL